MSLISLPLFKTDNTEKLEAADAYDISDSRPINKIWDATKDTATKLYDRAGGKEGIGNSIVSLLNAKKSGATGMQMLEQGLSMFGTSTMSILKTAGGGILDKAAGYIDMDPSMVEKIKSTGGELVSRLQYGDATDLSNYGNLTSLIGELTGYEDYAKYVNIGLESAVWGATFSEAVGFGSYHYLSDVKQYIDPEVYHQGLIYSVPVVATSGSLEAVQELMKNLTRDEIMATKPDFIKAFLQQFKLPTEMTVTMEAYCTSVRTVLNTLDPNWFKFQRQAAQVIPDLSVLSSANAAALKLFELDTELCPYAIAAPYATELTVDEVIRLQFPLMVTNLT